MSTDSVYVSYSWTVEKEKLIVDRLEQACQKHGVALKRDRNEINYKDSIRDYMDKLAAGGAVILVLSEQYFKSPYCMYELQEIYNNKNFHKRVFPIVLQDTPLYDPEDRLPYLAYWENKRKRLVEGLDELDRTYTKNLNKALDDYADFRRLMDELLSILADMNTLTEDIHVGTDFEALLDRIKPSQLTPAIRQRKREPDRDFRQKIDVKIEQILNQRSNLQIAMAEVTAIGKGNSGNLVEILCQTELETALDDMLRKATEKYLSVLDINSREYADTWEAAKSVLGWLSLLSVSNDWVKQQEEKLGSLSDLSFEIVVNTPCGVEIVSSRYRQIPPKLYMQPGKRDVRGSDLIEFPALETGWSDDYALEKLLLEIWGRVFPEETRQSLSDGDIRTLNATLARREKHKTYYYYIPVAEGDPSPLSRPDFYQKLLGKLPAMTVIYLKSSGGKSTLLVEDEWSFMTIIREFLTIPHPRR
jgi:TIR domain